MKSSVNWQVPVEMVGRAMGGNINASKKNMRNDIKEIPETHGE